MSVPDPAALLCAGALGGFAVSLFAVLSRAWVACRERAVVSATILLLGGALAARWLLVEPGYLHSNLHGPALADAALSFPRPTAFRQTYGPGGFMVAGALARRFGGGFRALASANQVIGVLMLGAAGWVAARWSGRATAALWTVAVGALWPPLTTVAASEDVTGVAVGAGLVALAAVDRLATRRSPAALVLYGCSLCLCILSRQTAWPLAVVVPLLGLARSGRPGRRPAFVLATAALACLLAYRALLSAEDPGDRVTWVLLPQLLLAWPPLFAVLLRHPLISSAGAAAVGPALIAGVVVAWRQGPLGRAIVLAVAFAFGLTLPLGVANDGDELGLRLALLGMALPLAGWGIDRLARLAPGWPAAARWPGAVALAFLLFFHGAVLPAFARPRRVAPMDAERKLLERVAGRLPAGAVLVEPLTAEPMPSYHLPRIDLPTGVEVVRADRLIDPEPGRARFFLSGVFCHGWSAAELWRRAGRAGDLPALDAVVAAYEGRLPAGLEPIPALRPACSRLLGEAVETVARVRVLRPFSEPPFVVFAGAFDLELVRLGSRAGRRRPAARPRRQ